MRICDLRLQNTHGYKNLGVRVQYARTILMTKFVSEHCTLSLAYAYKVKYTLALMVNKLDLLSLMEA